MEDKFHFKQFSVSHSRSSMKVGIDSIMLGAWAELNDAIRILDVGTGCGILALMAAQKNSSAIITAIDIDPSSIQEACENFKVSPWSKRLNAFQLNFEDFDISDYDFIISNPPYFTSGIKETYNPRLKARHQGTLNPEYLLEKSSSHLKPGSKIAMIIPADQEQMIIEKGQLIGFSVIRVMRIKGREELPYKRSMLLFLKDEKKELLNSNSSTHIIETMVIQDSKNNYTNEFRQMCKNFYLNM